MDSVIETKHVSVSITHQNRDESSILKWIIKIANVLLGINALWLGFLTIFNPCIFGGLVLVFGGILVLVLEIPILFGLFDSMKNLANLSQLLKPWQKMIIYFICPIVGLILCISATSIIASLLLFAVALIYFYLTFKRDTPN